MATYVMLGNWTDQGIRAVKDLPNRLDKSKAMLKEVGGTFREIYMTMGGYDFVVIYDAPDDAAAARYTVALGAQGNVRTTTLKAFPEAELRKIIASLT